MNYFFQFLKCFCSLDVLRSMQIATSNDYAIIQNNNSIWRVQERHGDHPDLLCVADQEGARVEDGEEEGGRAHLPAPAPLHC